jgi:hypothetical protein
MKTENHSLMDSSALARAACLGAAPQHLTKVWAWRTDGQGRRTERADQERSRSMGNDVKQVRLSAERADVRITQLVFHWDNRRDDAKDVGIHKTGGQTASEDARGRKRRLTALRPSPRSFVTRRRPG